MSKSQPVVFFRKLGKCYAVSGTRRTKATANRIVTLILKSQGYGDINHARKNIDNFEAKVEKATDQVQAESIIGYLNFTDKQHNGPDRFDFVYRGGCMSGLYLNSLYTWKPINQLKQEEN